MVEASKALLDLKKKIRGNNSLNMYVGKKSHFETCSSPLAIVEVQIDKMKSFTLTPNIEDIVVARAVSTNFDSVSEFSVFESTNSNSPKRMIAPKIGTLYKSKIHQDLIMDSQI